MRVVLVRQAVAAVLLEVFQLLELSLQELSQLQKALTLSCEACMKGRQLISEYLPHAS